MKIAREQNDNQMKQSENNNKQGENAVCVVYKGLNIKYQKSSFDKKGETFDCLDC